MKKQSEKGRQSPIASVRLLSESIGKIAPNLAPQVFPRQIVSDAKQFLVSIITTDQEKQQVTDLISCEQQKNPHSKLALVGSFNAKNQVFEFTGVQWLTDDEFAVYEFLQFYNLYLNGEEEKVERIVQLFLKKNGYSTDEVSVAEECFSMAYALRVLIRAFPSIPVCICGKQVSTTNEFSVDDVAKVFNIENLNTPKKKKKNEEKNSVKSKKSKKRKARAN